MNFLKNIDAKMLTAGGGIIALIFTIYLAFNFANSKVAEIAPKVEAHDDLLKTFITDDKKIKDRLAEALDRQTRALDAQTSFLQGVFRTR